MNIPAEASVVDEARGQQQDGRTMPGQSLIALVDYCQGFQRASEPWPPLPLADDSTISWWRQLIEAAPGGVVQGVKLLEALQPALPQLRLPQVPGISRSDLYRRLVLRGQQANPAERSAAGPEPLWQEVESLQLWLAPHACGAMPVLHTPNGCDFLLLVRALAHRGEPVALADGVHAQAVSGLIHWGLIHQFGPKSRAKLILLHQAPYGSVDASEVPGCPGEARWLELSTALRLEHELTHLATKRLLGEMRLNLLDELIADCMGMVAALGFFDSRLFGRCLGLDSSGETQAGGRWRTYVADLETRDADRAIRLLMERAHELAERLEAAPDLLQPEFTMTRLHWLCQQRLDGVISAWSAPSVH
jgi:hypothetical protein